MAQVINNDSNKSQLLLTPELIALYQSAGLKVPGKDKTISYIKNNIPKICLKDEIKKGIRILDETNAIQRYKAFNIPTDISSEYIERLIYYKGSICMFYCKALDDYFFMPYALDGPIDLYGRFFYIKPIPMTTGTTETPLEKAQAQYISSLRLKVYWDVPYKDLTYEERCNAAVIIYDYTPQLSQTLIPRATLQEPIIDMMAECYPLARTALFNSAGIKGMRVGSPDEVSNVLMANITQQMAALNGQQYIPIEGTQDFQELSNQVSGKPQDFLMTLQSLDNYRLSMYGLDSGGLFQKKSHMLESEQDMNSGRSKSALIDGLHWRQRACDIATSLWGIGMRYELSETSIGMDFNGDGYISDEKDQSGIPGDQPEMEVEEND